jgi:predicted ArsR family transcriptional regulator
MATNGPESAARHAALAVTSRRRLLEVLREAPEPLGAEELAAAVGLHVTTARHHLETLERAGLVQRSVSRAGRPGRPRLLYTAPSAAADGYRELAELLSTALGDDPDGGRRRAEQAGERWADEHVPAGDRAPGDVIGELQRCSTGWVSHPGTSPAAPSTTCC